jgi:ribosomal protein L7Ae-like RNA K-turn-binding protein
MCGTASSEVSDLVVNKVATLLHIAKKSFKVIHGFDVVVREIKRKKVCCVLLAEDLSLSTQRSFLHSIRSTNVDVIRFGRKDMYMDIFDKNIGIIGILDINISSGIKKHLSLVEK